MALEDLAARQDRARRDEEHLARQQEAIAQEQRALETARSFAGLTPAEKEQQTTDTARAQVTEFEAAQRKAAAGAPENKMLTGAGVANKGEATDGLDEVGFASAAARTAARDAGLAPETFKRRKKSSERGFTVADVDRIAAATAPDEQEDAAE